MKTTIRIVIAIVISILLVYCATTRKDRHPNLIAGTWKIIATNCDENGNNCVECEADQLCGIVFQFLENGDIVVKGRKTGAYRLEGSRLTIIDGNSTSSVKILHLDKKIMLTMEEGKKSTEKMLRIEQ
ncbi:MAG: hypothetical protein A2176_10160 [Spirochaetes bacterium RBG_13_51_14]|nr:MAG: hypothetical protein A2176_10160 [Spirochaetes bacterium RBG_13_51_14]